jgi:hypothetical protein
MGHYDADGNWVGGSTADQQSPNSFDTDYGQYIPLDLAGSNGRIQAQRDARTADTNRSYWDTLRTPSASQLDSTEGQQAQRQALMQMQQWGQGGLTATDRSALESTRGRDMQASGAAQRGLMQQAQARGIGGSGLDFASRQMAAQSGQQQSSDAESQMLQGAQQRALQAMGASAQLGGQMRDQAGQGAQRAFEDQSSRAAGATGQYGTDAQTTQAQRDRRRQSDTSLYGFLASI